MMLTSYKSSKMEQNLFPSLPPEIMIDILLRLPIKTIGRCKCVCKSWLDLIKTREFVKSHLTISVPGLALFEQQPSSSRLYKIIEFVDTQDSRWHDFNVVFNFNSPPGEHLELHSSVNGLLFLLNRKFRDLLICNPITCEYIKLPPPKKVSLSKLIIDCYGFGVSKLSGKYKVVRMFYESYRSRNGEGWKFSNGKCEVYTLGTGSWRRIKACYLPKTESLCIFSNGNLHWFVYDEGRRDPQRISCFDLETECVTIFSAPHFVAGDHRTLCVLRDHGLCVCDNSSDDIVIWSMNEYGDGKFWRKGLVIKNQGPFAIRGPLVLLPIKIFDDGDILFVHRYCIRLCYYYSSKTKTSREINLAELFGGRNAWYVIYTPSFLSLKTLTTMENVCSL